MALCIPNCVKMDRLSATPNKSSRKPISSGFR